MEGVTVTEYNIHIEDGYKTMYPTNMKMKLYAIKRWNPDCKVFNRSYKSLVHEWRAHNRLYKLGICRSRTKDVDLNYPQKWYAKVFYNIFGLGL